MALNELGKKDFGTVRYYLCSKARPHASKSAIEESSNCIEIGLGDRKEIAYDDWKTERYMMANNITYDLIVTMYEVNTSKGIIYRILDGKGMDSKKIIADARKISSKNQNIEARIIGLQNGSGFEFIKGILEALSAAKVGIAEIDLFGSDTRNIAIDLKSGMSYNVLLNDKNYMAGELANKMSREEYERSLGTPASLPA